MTRSVPVPRRQDVVVALGWAACTVAELFAPYAFPEGAGTTPGVSQVAVAVAMSVAMAWRRTWPTAVGPLVSGLALMQSLWLSAPNVYSQVLLLGAALYSIAAYGQSLSRRSIGAGITLLLMTGLGLSHPGDPVGETVTGLVFAGFAFTAGRLVGRHRVRAVSLQLERDAARESAGTAAALERLRIARELHDVVSHGMSVVILQARGGAHVVESDPAQARQVLAEIERVAAGCLDEMRRWVGVQRAIAQSQHESDVDPPESRTACDAGATTPLAPQPRLTDLPALVTRARASGADISLLITGHLTDHAESGHAGTDHTGTDHAGTDHGRPLQPGLELTAYRVVQEALTNVLVHAPGSRTRITVAHEPGGLVLEVVDDGRSTPTVAADRRPAGVEGRSGHGLAGMRERVHLFGGTLTAGPAAGGGFVVRATLPVPDPAPRP